MANESKAKESVLDHFDIVGVQPGEVFFKGETIHLGSLTLEKAHQLHAMGFPYLKPKGKNPVK